MMWLTSFFARSIFGISYKALGTLLIISAISLAYFYEKHAHNASVQALEAFKQNIAIEVARKEAENAIKHQIAQKEADKAQKTHDAEQVAILNNLQNIIIKGKKQNEDTKTKLDTTTNQLERLRLAVKDSVNGVPEGDKSGQSTQSGSDDNTALLGKISTCEAASAVTTSDYNALRLNFDANCELTGCE
jgi:type I site-specific restriction endonuclease